MFDDLIPRGESGGEKSGSGAFDDLVPKSSAARRILGDTGVSLLRGAISVPEAAVGLLDIPTGGRAGQMLEQAGFRPKEAKDILSGLYSPEQRAANAAVQRADGVMGTLSAVAETPSVIWHTALESTPLMGAGGAVARGIGAASKLSPMIRGAIGEGAVGAGLAAEGIRQETGDGQLTGKQAALALLSGAGTGALGAAGGKVAQRLGIADVDTALAGGAGGSASKGVKRRAIEGAASEGLLEELPQSLQEQALQNIALDRPIDEGLAQAGVLGALAGVVMGGGASAILRQQPASAGQPQPERSPEPQIDPNAGPLSRAASILHGPTTLDTIRAGNELEAQRAAGLRAEEDARQQRVTAGQVRDSAAQALAEGAFEADRQAAERRGRQERLQSEGVPFERIAPEDYDTLNPIKAGQGELVDEQAQALPAPAGRDALQPPVSRQALAFEPATARPMQATERGDVGTPEQIDALKGQQAERKDQMKRAREQARNAFPFVTEKAARKQAERMAAATGEAHDVVPHPKVKGRFAAIPAPQIASPAGDGEQLTGKLTGDSEAPAEAVGFTNSLSRTASWVIRNKETGEAVLETFDKAKVDALNTDKYEAVPIQEYLGSINGQTTGQGGRIASNLTPTQQQGPGPADSALAAQGGAPEGADVQRGGNDVVPQPDGAGTADGAGTGEPVAGVRTGVAVGDGGAAQPAVARAPRKGNPPTPEFMAAADDLSAMAGSAGWAEVGGRLTRRQTPQGEVVERTKWMPNAEWFQAGMEQDAQTIRDGVEAMRRGEFVPAKTRRTIEGMQEWLAYQQEGQTPPEDSSIYDMADIGYDELPAPVADMVDSFEEFGRDMSDADAMRALGFTEDEISAELQQTEVASRQPDAAGAPAGAAGDQATVETPAGAGGEDFRLEQPTQEGLRQQADRVDQAQQAEAQRQAAADQKAAADAERDGFVLSGSDRAADVAAARGQGGLFDSPVANKPKSSANQAPVKKESRAVAGGNGDSQGGGQNPIKKPDATPKPAEPKRDEGKAERIVSEMGGGVKQSRTQESFLDDIARVRKATTVTADRLKAAIAQRFPSISGAVDAMLKRGEAGRRGGLVMLDTTNEEQIAEAFAKATGRTMSGARDVLRMSDEDGAIQGLFDPQSGLTFLVGPNLTDQTAPAVLLHEITHSQQRKDIDAKALNMIERRARMPMTKDARAFLGRVEQRMRDAGVEGDAAEASAYVVEQAVLEGRQAGFSAADGKFLSWIDETFSKRVGNLVRDFVSMVRAWGMRHGAPIRNLAIDDLVAFAKAGAKAAARGDVAAAQEGGSQSKARSLDDITRSEAFKEWFGQSLMKDKSGKPLTFMHGSPNAFEAFDNAKLGASSTHATSGLGHFFTRDADTAERYADGGQVYRGWLRMAKPYVMSLEEAQALESIDESVARRQALQEQGHDGAIILDDQGKPWAFVAFDPWQFKSTENRGTFDEFDDRFRFSRGKNGDNIGGMADRDRVASEQVPDPAGDGKTGGAKPDHRAAAQQILDSIEADDDFSDYGLRVIPDEFDGTVAVGDILPESRIWQDGNVTDDTLDGTSAVEIRRNSLDGVLAAIRDAGAHGKPGRNGYYPGSRVVLVKGDRIGSGEDVGEVILRDAEVVGIWRKTNDSNSELIPNEPSAPAGSGVKFSRAPKKPAWLDAMPQAAQEAARKAGVWAPQVPISARIREIRSTAAKRLQQGLVDQFAPLKELGDREYILARLTKSSDAPLEALLMYGKPRMNAAGAVTVDQSGGFIDAMQELNGEHDRFFAWMAGNRAEQLKAEGRENLFTDEDISALKGLSAGKMEDGRGRAMAYRRMHARFNEFGKSVLDIAERAGIIGDEDRAIWESDFYVPFYRALEDGDYKGPRNVSGLVNQYAFKALKGGTDNLNDLMQNTLRNWSHLLSASLKNQAAAASLKTAEAAGIAAPVQQKQKGSVTYLDGGKERHMMVDDPFILNAITSLEWAGWNNPAMRWMQKAKHYLTLGVTISPTFKIRNLIRDQVAAIGQNPVSYNLLRNLSEGWKGTDKTTAEYANMLAGGGLMRFGTFLEDDRAAHLKRLIDAGVSADTVLDSPKKVRAALAKAWDWWQEVGDRSENITRAAIYKQRRQDLIAEGKSEDEAHLLASFAARDSMDFSLHGQWGSIRFLTQLVPFLNARLQGLYKLGREGVAPTARLLTGQEKPGDRERAIRFGAVTGAVALASMALMLAYRDDDDWKKREEWDRDAYWWFKVGDTAYRIPKPFEIGAIGTLAERGLDTALDGFDEESSKLFAKRLGAMVTDTFAMNPVPQLVKPLIDLYANTDSFTGRPIETMGMERLSKANRIGVGTSATAQLAGKATSLVGLSPVQLDHIVDAYFSWLGTHIVMTADFALRPMMGLPDKPARRWPDGYFVVGDFAKGLPAPQSKYVTQFYEQSKKVQQAMADIRYYQSLGQTEKALELRHENAREVGLYRVYTRAQRQLSDINRRMRAVQVSGRSPEEKRDEIDRLSGMKDRLAQSIEARRVALQ